MARTPKPDAHLKMAGTWREDRHGDRLAVAAGIPDCPPWVDGEAVAIFNRLCAMLSAVPGLLSRVDAEALALLADALADYCEARDIVRQQGVLAKSDKGTSYMHPAVAVKAEAWKRVRRGFADFGLSPAERAKIKIALDSGEAVDPLEAALA